MKAASSQGLWALLFVMLLFYVLKTNEKRENKLQSIIDKLADKLGLVEKMQKDIEEIKEKI